MIRERRTTRQRRVIHVGGGVLHPRGQDRKRCLSDLTGCFTYKGVRSWVARSQPDTVIVTCGEEPQHRRTSIRSECVLHEPVTDETTEKSDALGTCKRRGYQTSQDIRDTTTCRSERTTICPECCASVPLGADTRHTTSCVMHEVRDAPHREPEWGTHAATTRGG